MKKALFWTLLVTAIGICQTNDPLSKSVVDGITQFAADLYRVLSSSQKNENILYSPLGAALALGMVHLGAKGKAQQEIGQLLNLQGKGGEYL